ncbi:MAG: hypothetical protein H8D35_05005 [Nitrosopumilus sp.]|jgi:hypothetical protein|nr:hypothetical protein [Nitrosopumilus sp.]
MKKITILIPKIKPPNVSDIVTTQIENILSELSNQFTLNVIWLIFQPATFSDYSFKTYQVVDYHKYDNAVDVIDKIQPDLIINEVRLGINGICFGISSKYRKIPNITITPTGKSEFFSTAFSTKSNFQLIFSDKIIADVSNNKPKKFSMLKYSIHRYGFLLKSLKNSGYRFIDLLKFILFYPRFQILSKTYPALHKITSGNFNFCFNEHWFSRLLDAKFDKSTLILVGDPAFDELYDENQNSYSDKFNSNKTKILFCPTPMHEHGWLTKTEEDNLILKIIKEIKNYPQFEVSLKIHPSSSSYDEYELLLKSLNQPITLFQKENIMSLLKEFDVMLTYGSSNVILNGILSKTPVILFNFDQKNKLTRLNDSEIIKECNDMIELHSQLSSIKNPISKEILENYIKSQIGIFDGKNSQRIAKYIEKLIKTN